MIKAWAGTVVIGAGTAANAGVITFEELGGRPDLFSATTALRDQIVGASFIGGIGRIDGGAVLNQSSGFGFNARSGEHFLAFNRDPDVKMSDGGLPIDPEKITFSEPASAVEIFAATGDDGSGSVGKYLLQAFSNTDALLAEDTQEAMQEWTRLAVSSDQAIAYVVLTELTGFVAFAYDDLGYTPVPAPASCVLALLAGSLATRRRRSCSTARC